jgi:cyclopropane fatty-acyl-phospholipid synthase-like methyltransferase
MPSADKTKLFYDTTAAKYAGAFFNELCHKPFDREILKRFADDNKLKGLMADIGCGPGQTTNYLSDLGISEIIGIDFSEKMIEQAKKLNRKIQFETGDLLDLKKPGEYYGSVVAFYAIVHFNQDQLKQCFSGVYKTLRKTGQFLLSFHIGKEVITVDEFMGEKVSADFYFHDPDKVRDLLKEAGFEIIETITRYPYPAEYQSKRAYIIAEKS